MGSDSYAAGARDEKRAREAEARHEGVGANGQPHRVVDAVGCGNNTRVANVNQKGRRIEPWASALGQSGRMGGGGLVRNVVKRERRREVAGEGTAAHLAVGVDHILQAGQIEELKRRL